ncbi:MAG: hypothetical protein HOI95_29630 [Chromatiales bacterium]|jgi:hypothetical protein|nr:hypothetical protein [Chromatiales bacterium]
MVPVACTSSDIGESFAAGVDIEGDIMSGYQYFIYRIESDPFAAGEYIGPFSTREQRDDEAARLRSESVTSLHYGVSVYRADVADDVAETLETRPAVAA